MLLLTCVILLIPYFVYFLSFISVSTDNIPRHAFLSKASLDINHGFPLKKACQSEDQLINFGRRMFVLLSNHLFIKKT